MKATISIQLEPGEELIPEARAVQTLQDGLALAARSTPEELARIWRAAVAECGKPQRPRHEHRRKVRGA